MTFGPLGPTKLPFLAISAVYGTKKFSRYLKDINFRAVVIFAPKKNAKITTRENDNT